MKFATLLTPSSVYTDRTLYSNNHNGPNDPKGNEMTLIFFPLDLLHFPPHPVAFTSGRSKAVVLMLIILCGVLWLLATGPIFVFFFFCFFLLLFFFCFFVFFFSYLIVLMGYVCMELRLCVGEEGDYCFAFP